MAFGESLNQSFIFWKSTPEMEMGDGAFSGSDVGESTGVVRGLDAVEELLEDEDGLEINELSELKDEVRELRVNDREDEDEASEVAGLAPRYVALGSLGVLFERRTTFLRGALLFEIGAIAGRAAGLGDRAGRSPDEGVVIV